MPEDPPVTMAVSGNTSLEYVTMRIGLTVPVGGVALSELCELVRGAEASGYDSAWSEESVNLDGARPPDFVLSRTAGEALATAKRNFVAYATVSVYTEFFRWLGWSEAVDPLVAAWRAGDRVKLVPDEVVKEILSLGRSTNSAGASRSSARRAS
jgi:hypothetical protein